MDRFCKECGGQIPADARFCPQCGSSADGQTALLEETANAQQNSGSVSTANPDYYVPQSDSLKEKFFTAKGRLGRWAYFKRNLLLLLLMMGGCTTVFLFGMMAASTEPGDDAEGILLISALLALILWIPCYISSIILQIRRIHDIGHTGWVVLCSLIPPMSFAYMIYILFRKGTDGDNPYGPDPLS